MISSPKQEDGYLNTSSSKLRHTLKVYVCRWSWCLPCGFDHIVPYFYVIYFGILLGNSQDCLLECICLSCFLLQLCQALQRPAREHKLFALTSQGRIWRVGCTACHRRTKMESKSQLLMQFIVRGVTTVAANRSMGRTGTDIAQKSDLGSFPSSISF